MRFFPLVAPAITALAALASAIQPNTINYPYSGISLTAGQTMNIKWTPTTPGTVSLILREGAANDLSTIATIASGIPNNGAASFSIPRSTSYSAYYSIEIVSDSDPSEINYSAPFVIYTAAMAKSLHRASHVGHTSTRAPHRPTEHTHPHPHDHLANPHKGHKGQKVVLGHPTTSADIAGVTHIHPGAAPAVEVRGGVAAMLAVGAGVAFVL